MDSGWDDIDRPANDLSQPADPAAVFASTSTDVDAI